MSCLGCLVALFDVLDSKQLSQVVQKQCHHSGDGVLAGLTAPLVVLPREATANKRISGRTPAAPETSLAQPRGSPDMEALRALRRAWARGNGEGYRPAGSQQPYQARML